MSFSDLGLSPETLKAVEDVGYNTPTPIQEQAIPYVLMGRDVLGIAQTGTGKTASFTLPMIDILAQGRAKARMPRSLILAPTRELANQVAENFTLYGKYHKLSMALLIGGESFSEQEKALDRGVDVLIATPGRLMDLFDRGRILLSDVKVLVIDEADRMLDMGFIPDVERIVSLLPVLRQTLFFSATMDAPIRKLVDAFLSNPKEVRVAPKQQTATTVTQHLLVVDEFDKREALRHILRLEEVRNAFIFCNRKRDVGILFRSLKKHGFDVGQLHGDMPQQERTATLAQFKAGDVRLLVCSDVAARGIDIADVSHVFNFDVPSHCEDYVHRIGRTGRAGREGRAYTLATPEDVKAVAAVEKLIGNAIPRLDLEGIESQELSEEAAKAARKARRTGGNRRGNRREDGRSETRRDDTRREDNRREDGRRDDSRRDDNRRDDSRKRDQAEGEVVKDVVEAAVEPRREDPRREDPRREDPRKDDGRQDNRARRDRSRGSRRNHPAWEVEEMDHGDDVAAFGTHTPAFMTVEVRAFVGAQEDLLSDEDADRLEDEVVQVIDDVEEVDTSDEIEDPRDEDNTPRSRNRRRRRRSRDRDEGAEADQEASADLDGGEGADDDQRAVGSEDDQPNKPRRRRSARRRKSEALAEQAARGDEGESSEDTAERETGTDAPHDSAQGADGVEAMEAPQDQADAESVDAPVAKTVSEKPKRTTRRRRTVKAEDTAPHSAVDAAAEAVAAEGVPEEVASEAPVDAQAAEAVSEKPKRTRKPAVKKAASPRTRKKATAEENAEITQGSASAASEGETVSESPVVSVEATDGEGEAVTDKPKRTRKPAVKKATSPRSRKAATPQGDEAGEMVSESPVVAEGGAEAPTEKPKRTRAPRKKKVDEASEAVAEGTRETGEGA